MNEQNSRDSLLFCLISIIFNFRMKPTTVSDIYEFLSAEVRSSSYMSVALDSHLNYIAVNEIVCNNLGVSETELIGNIFWHNEGKREVAVYYTCLPIVNHIFL